MELQLRPGIMRRGNVLLVGAPPLIGRTGLFNNVTDALRVDCPDCQRQYYIVPEEGDFGRVALVKEI